MWWRNRSVAWLGVLLAGFFYAWLWTHGATATDFWADDYGWILQGRRMLEDPIARWDDPFIVYWRPVTVLCFGFLDRLFGLDPIPYLIVATVLHLLNGLLIADIALKFRSGALPAALATLYFLLGSSYAVVPLWVTGIAISFPTFLALLGIRLGIARGTPAHIGSILVLTLAMLAREAFALVPALVVFLIPREEHRWAKLSLRFARCLLLLTTSYLVARWIWHGNLDPQAIRSTQEIADFSIGNVLQNLWQFARRAIFPPRSIEPEGFWVACLAIGVALSITTSTIPNRRRILRLFFGAIVVFLPSTVLRGPVAFETPRQLYAPAAIAAVAFALVLTLRPTDQQSSQEGCEESCLRGLGEVTTIALLVWLLYQGSSRIFESSMQWRLAARSSAERLDVVAETVRDKAPGARLVIVGAGTQDGGTTLPADEQTIRNRADLEVRESSMELEFLVNEDPFPRLVEIAREPERTLVLGCTQKAIGRLALLLWDEERQAYRGRIEQAGNYVVLAPRRGPTHQETFLLTAHGAVSERVTLTFSEEDSLGIGLARLNQDPIHFEVDPQLELRVTATERSPHVALLLLLRVDPRFGGSR